MPKEIKSRREVLRAIEDAPPLADLLEMHDGHYQYELDLEVCVYGRNYQGKQVGPYIRLLACESGETIIRQGDWGGNTFYVGVDYELDVFVRMQNGAESRVASIPVGAPFGEMSVLAGVPRAATVKAAQDTGARILEVQRPALRLLRKIPFFRDSLDAVYARHGKLAAFQRMRIAPAIGDYMLRPASFGLSRFQVFSKNHVLAQQGSPVDELYVIKEGWLRRTTTDGRRDFLGHGYCLGLETAPGHTVWPFTVTLLSRTEVLVIPLLGLSDIPEFRDSLIRELSAFAPPAIGGGRALPPEIRAQMVASQARLISTGIVDATNLLVMDMKLCIRCGRCSLACHEIHGQSRLVRRGIAVQRLASPPAPALQALLVPTACLHCQDPECLTGCPTGAIGRFPGGQVDINPKSCIGCGDCAVNCPYNAISMIQRSPKPTPALTTRQRLTELVQIRDAPLPPPVELKEELLAVKCNLCQGTALNPTGSTTPAYGCEENCPTGALTRVSPRDYFGEITAIEGPAYPPEKTGGRNIHRSDPPARTIHLAGISTVLVAVLMAIFGLMRLGFNGVFAGVFTIRWVTGIVGLAGIAGTMSYPWRRRVFRKKAGPLRYWLLGHIYFGVLGAAMILLHGGTASGGALTTALAVSFDLVILTGLWGICCYQVVPRWLVALEPGTPLLVDDLNRRREELEARISDAMAMNSAPARELANSAVGKLFSWRFMIRQFTHRETLEDLSAEARRDFAGRKAKLADMEDSDRMDRLTDSVTLLRRLDALRFLHWTLKSWLIPHVVATSLMLTLLVFHILQVVYEVS
jgi:Fe-S-cluster-containing dehydrogenase component